MCPLLAGSIIVSATDIAKLDLDADLVFLSACSAGYIANVAQGERKLPSLVSAFFHAGARSLLTTNLNVQSDTSVDVATAVAREISGGNRPSMALFKTLKQLIDSGVPIEQWSPFAHYGFE